VSSKESHQPEIKDKIKYLMKERGISSVTSLAKLLKIPQPTAYKIFSGITKNPRQDLLDKLADFFNVPVSYFLHSSIESIGNNNIPVYLLSPISLSKTEEIIPVTNNKIFKVILIGTNDFFPEIKSGSYLYLSKFSNQEISEGMYALYDMNEAFSIVYFIRRNRELFFKDIRNISGDLTKITENIARNMIGLIEEIIVKRPTKSDSHI